MDVLFSPRYDVHRYEANYAKHDRHVDVDYDADCLRFGRVAKPLDK
ncbi:MAG TPA: hypothetical protein VN850_09095 [Candidatus Acidoferrales bacterium]|nr:hypothetical protein [Candidatus Acidoferrales bacterium]